jgi:hypothetical protein
MKKLLLYLFLIVISDPYKDIQYDQINVYDVNYCSEYCYNQNDSNWNYFEDAEPEEIDEEDREEVEESIKEEFKFEEEKPLIFPVDFFQT